MKNPINKKNLGRISRLKKRILIKPLELLEGNVIQKESGPLRKGTEQIYEKKHIYLNEPKGKFLKKHS